MEGLQEYINQLVIQGMLYTTQLPASVSNAIYLYGSNDIKNVVAFIDVSEKCDGTRGMIIGDEGVYFHFKNNVSILYKDIKELFLIIKRNHIKGKVKTNEIIVLEDLPIHLESFMKILSLMSDVDINIQMSMYQKIAYYVPVVLNDLENEEYEDVLLDSMQIKQINDFKGDLEVINKMEEQDYQYELETLCIKALQFFDDLGLDSEEIDILLDVYKQIEEKNQKEEDMYENAKKYYDDMMDNYKHGDGSMFNNVKSIMSSMGIDLDNLKDQSPDEMEKTINDICDRFHISRSQLEKVVNKCRH